MAASTKVSTIAVRHLSEHSLRHLRTLLVAASNAEAVLGAEHASTVRQLRDLTDADSVLERELAEVGVARAQLAGAEIRHALERLDTGAYGQCEECDAPVPFERLEAVPAARFCVRCPTRRAGWR